MGFFGWKEKKMTFADLKLDELRREKIQMEQKITRLERDAEKVTASQKQLKNEYACAETPTQKRSTARKLQDSDAESKRIASRISYCHKAAQTYTNFINIKEDIEFYKGTPLYNVINKMDPKELEQYVGDAVVDGQLNKEKLAALLQASGEGSAALMDSNGDDDLDDYMKMLDKETESLRADNSIKNAGKTISEMTAEANAGIESIDKELNFPQ